MSPQPKWYLILATGLVFLLAACQPAPSRNTTGTSIGRTPRGMTNFANGQPSPVSSNNPATQWGQIVNSAGDQAFAQALYLFTAPMLQGLPADQQLGYVSSQAGQSTGVVFWGIANVYGAAAGYAGAAGSGTLDGSSAVIHIEIFDSNTGTMDSDGNVVPQIIVHIGADQPGFVSAQGTVAGGQANLTFTDNLGSVVLQGMIEGQYFTGTVGYTNQYTGGMTQILGQFQVPACGFFVCN